MNRIRFSRLGGTPAETPSATESRAAAESRAPAIEQPAGPSANAPISREDRELIEQVQTRLLSESTSVNTQQDPTHYSRRIAQLVTEQLEITGRVISDRERARLTRIAQAELLGLGPLEPLLSDDSISEIMVNGANQIWVERDGKLTETNSHFIDDEHVRRIIEWIISPLGRRCAETMPMVDARLPDGSRVNAIIPPLCLNGPSLTIRKFFKTPLSGADLVRRGACSPELMELLRACVMGRLNVIISGGTGTGKTTLLNVLSSYIPEDERILTIENAAELQLQQRHVITLESRPPNIEGRNEIIQLERLQDGSRRIVQVSEVTGLSNDIIAMSDLFVFQRQGMQDGRVIGHMMPTGIRPRFMDRLQLLNITLPPSVFGAHSNMANRG